MTERGGERGWPPVRPLYRAKRIVLSYRRNPLQASSTSSVPTMLQLPERTPDACVIVRLKLAESDTPWVRPTSTPV